MFATIKSKKTEVAKATKVTYVLPETAREKGLAQIKKALDLAKSGFFMF